LMALPEAELYSSHSGTMAKDPQSAETDLGKVASYKM